MTAGAAWRRRRALVIFAVYGRPFTQRQLADVFDLSRRSVRGILASLSAESGHGAIAATANARAAWVSAALRSAAHGRSQKG